MSFATPIATHFRAIHFGPSMTGVSYKDALEGVDFALATTKVHSLNTIATLTFHHNYYTAGVSKTLMGGPLDIADKYSFDHPPFEKPEDWQQLLAKFWDDLEQMATIIDGLSDEDLLANFGDGKYGSKLDNILGFIEHAQYHLGQISLVKKLAMNN